MIFLQASSPRFIGLASDEEAESMIIRGSKTNAANLTIFDISSRRVHLTLWNEKAVSHLKYCKKIEGALMNAFIVAV